MTSLLLLITALVGAVFTSISGPARSSGIELGSGSSDNSMGQGSKEDDPAVKIVQGSVPKQKSDLTRFYAASDFVNGENYLYLAWQRANVLGSANMDVELNQASTPGLSATFTGPITLNRTTGDLLVTFDLSGSDSPVLGLLRWVYRRARQPVLLGRGAAVLGQPGGPVRRGLRGGGGQLDRSH